MFHFWKAKVVPVLKKEVTCIVRVSLTLQLYTIFSVDNFTSYGLNFVDVQKRFKSGTGMSLTGSLERQTEPLKFSVEFSFSLGHYQSDSAHLLKVRA